LSSEQAIIEMDIVLSARASGQIREILDEVKKKKSEKKEKGTDELAEDLLEVEKEKKKTELTEALEGLDKSDLKKLEGLLKHPESFIEGGMENLLKRLGPNAPMILGIVGLVIASPILFAEIMKALSVKGGPFNRDWRRFISKEFDVGLSREQSKLKELGFDQVILTQVQGMKSNNTGWTYNSLYQVDETRLARIGLSDRAAGVTAFG